MSGEQAEKAYISALELDQQNSEARYGLARVYMAKNRLEEAFRTMEILANEKYPSEDVYDVLAEFYEQSGAAEESMKVYQTWMSLFPKSRAAHYKFGRYLERKGEKEKSVSYLQKAKALK